MRKEPAPPKPAFLSRLDRLATVDSTQRVVREWLAAGTPEVAVAVADEQTAGRGRLDRSWHAPLGAALLLSIGFRPADLPARHGWRLAATVSLAMADAAEAAAGLPDSTIRLKWPNDLVTLPPDGHPLKLAGVLGESAAHGASVDWAVVGIGVNVDWAKADFPADLAQAMTSLREVAAGRPVDREQLLREFLARLEPRYEALSTGAFDAAGWTARQVTTGQHVDVDVGGTRVSGTAVGVDPETGALMLESAGERHSFDSGEVVRVRMMG